MSRSGCKLRASAGQGAAAGVRFRRATGGLVARIGLVLILMPAMPVAFPGPARAEDSSQVATVSVADLERSLGIAELVGVLAREGQGYGDTLDQSMFGGKGGPRWKATVSRIYDPAVLSARFSRAFEAALAGQPELVAKATAYISTPAGQRIMQLERAARETLLEPDAREAAEVNAAKLRDARSPRLKQIRRLIEAGDLIESNVAAELTGSAAFNEALAATQPPEQRLPEVDRMAQVWRQESEIRAGATSWLVTFMTLAYAPLSDEELQAWVDFSASETGKALHQAVSTAFSETFREVMAELGHEAGQVLLGSRI